MSTTTEVENYHDMLHHSLAYAKVGLILFFILVTVVYQTKYRNVQSAFTFFGQSSTRWKVIADACIAGFLGVISTMFVITSRSGWRSIGKHWSTLLIVFVILMLFALAQESSGFNRYLAKHETVQGKGVYAKLEGTDTEEGRKKFEEEQKGGDPFENALSSTTMLLVGLFLMYFIARMFKATYLGYCSGENTIEASTAGSGLGGMSKNTAFALEVLVVVVLNAFAPAISAAIRGEHFSKMTGMVVTGIAVIALGLQFMLQYTGFLNFTA